MLVVSGAEATSHRQPPQKVESAKILLSCPWVSTSTSHLKNGSVLQLLYSCGLAG